MASTADTLRQPTASQSGKAAARKRSLLSEMRRSWYAYALLAPIFAFLIVFMYYPPILGFIGSFYQWAPGKESVFVGANNYVSYFTYPETGRELGNIVKILIIGWCTGVVVPFLMAEMIFSVRSAVAKRVYRILVSIPLIAPGVVVVLLWKYIYDPNLGLLNGVLGALGLKSLQLNWLGDPSTALYAILGVGFPWVAGIGTLIYLGGLAQISESIFDSCLLEGCWGLKRVWLIDLPMVRGQIRLLTVLAVIHAVTSFESILVLTDGGPGFATMVPALSMYRRAFTSQQFGYASAIGVILFIIAVSLTGLINRLFSANYD